MLLEHLEKELDLPTVSVYPADGSRSEAKVVGEKFNFSLAILIPDYHPTQQAWILEASLWSGEADDLVGEDISAVWQRAVMYDFISCITLESGDEENAGFIPLPEEIKITISSVYSDDAARGKREMASGDYIGSLAVSDYGKVWQVTIVVKQQVELDGAFGLTKVCPGKQAETEVDGGRIKAEQLVLEAKLLLFTRALTIAKIPQVKEGILIKLPGTVSVGIGKGALCRSSAQSQVTELATGDSQSVADLSQAFSLGQLTEEHGHILIPGGEALSMALCPTFMDQAQKRDTGDNLEYLAEQTCGKLHDRDSFVVFSDSVMVSPYYFGESLFYYKA